MRVIAPVYIELGKYKRKKHYINLNNYPNWHFQVYNKLKKEYYNAVLPQIKGVVLRAPISLRFHLIKGTKRKTDRSNVLSVHDKFFCDALTQAGCIEDDNDDYIEKSIYTSSYEKGKGAVIIDIIESNHLMK